MEPSWETEWERAVWGEADTGAREVREARRIVRRRLGSILVDLVWFGRLRRVCGYEG